MQAARGAVTDEQKNIVSDQAVVDNAQAAVGQTKAQAAQSAQAVQAAHDDLAVVLIGGLTSSTLLTLLVVPVLYTMIDDAVRSCARWFRTPVRRSPRLMRREWTTAEGGRELVRNTAGQYCGMWRVANPADYWTLLTVLGPSTRPFDWFRGTRPTGVSRALGGQIL